MIRAVALTLAISLPAIAQQPPTAANIRGEVFSIAFVPLVTGCPTRPGATLWGCTLCDPHTIEVRTGQEPREALIHELLHAETCKVDGSDDDAIRWYNSDPKATDHEGFYHIAWAFNDIFTRNPELVLWLAGKDETK